MVHAVLATQHHTLGWYLHARRLYLALVILGALHGLVLLPVLLALFGPPSLAQNGGSAPGFDDGADGGQLLGGGLASGLAAAAPEPAGQVKGMSRGR